MFVHALVCLGRRVARWSKTRWGAVFYWGGEARTPCFGRQEVQVRHVRLGWGGLCRGEGKGGVVGAVGEGFDGVVAVVVVREDELLSVGCESVVVVLLAVMARATDGQGHYRCQVVLWSGVVAVVVLLSCCVGDGGGLSEEGWWVLLLFWLGGTMRGAGVWRWRRLNEAGWRGPSGPGFAVALQGSNSEKMRRF